MAKRVLGNDPFGDGKDDESAVKSSAPKGSPSKRPSMQPAGKSGKSEAPKSAKASVAPPAARNAKPSIRPSKAPSPSKGPSAHPSKRAAAPVSKRPPARPSKPPSFDASSEKGPDTIGDVAEHRHRPAIEQVIDESASHRATPPKLDPDAIVPRAPLVANVSVGAHAIEDDLEGSPSNERGDDESIAAADLPPDLQRTEAAAPSEPPSAPRASVGSDVKEDIRSIEAEIDRLLDNVSDRGADRATLDRVAARLREKIGNESESEAPAPATSARDDVFDVARELLSSDYYRQQWGRVAMRDRAEEVDDFGLDPKYAARVRPFFDFLYERWWRVETHDIDRVPSDGRVILCANHSGALPYDGAMLSTAMRREHPAHRDLRWLAEDFIFHFPFLGVFMNRIGAVRACQENAERLLRKASCVGVFPEGVKGISKLYRDRYKLQRFGRGGHVKLAIRTRTPIVPVAILGAEEAHPLIAPTSVLAKALGVPFVPITPTFPWFGPLGLVPVPSKWKIFFLEPITMDAYPPEAADDEVLVGRLNEKIRGLIQDELDRAVKSRASVFKG